MSLQHPAHVLFLCNHNTARSLMAEAVLNHIGGEHFRAHSAGCQPSPDGQAHPLALEALQSAGVRTEGLRSKGWDEFTLPEAPHMDLVITLCDDTAAEVCPVWPGQPISAHWGVADPAAATGTDEQRHRAFNDAFSVLSRRISLLLCLPIEKLSRLALQNEVAEIGRVLDTAQKPATA